MLREQTHDVNQLQINTIPSKGFDIPIYLPSGKSGLIKIPSLTKEEWDQLIAILNVYKPSVIKEVKLESEKNETEGSRH